MDVQFKVGYSQLHSFIHLTGYDGLLSSVASNNNKATVKPEDRIFSNSSVTGNV